jgi:hypothetical protein
VKLCDLGWAAENIELKRKTIIKLISGLWEFYFMSFYMAMHLSKLDLYNK